MAFSGTLRSTRVGETTGATMLRGSTKPGGGGARDRGLLEVARRVAGGRDLLDALAEEIAAAHDVEDLGLVERHFDGAGSDVVRSGMDVEEIGGHRFLSG